jgi:putative dimethyl sulfoxide reductase chaperone
LNIEEIIKYEAARSVVYKVLALCYQPPSHELGEYLKDLETGLTILNSEALSNIVLMRSEWLHIKREHTELKVDFARLFVGPYSLPAPPYGSLYLDGNHQIMGDSTMDVQRRYEEVGIDLSDKFNETPDHIAAELEFLYV